MGSYVHHGAWYRFCLHLPALFRKCHKSTLGFYQNITDFGMWSFSNEWLIIVHRLAPHLAETFIFKWNPWNWKLRTWNKYIVSSRTSKNIFTIFLSSPCISSGLVGTSDSIWSNPNKLNMLLLISFLIFDWFNIN
jgi:hypothetical protein